VQNQYTPQPEARGGVPVNEDVDMADLLSAPPAGTRGVAAGVPGQLTQDLELSEKAIHHVKTIAMESVSLWGYGHLAFGVGLVVTELLANAMQHTTMVKARLVIQVLWAGSAVGRLVVVVHDDDPTMPTERRADDLALDGRGLTLVRGLANSLSFVPAERGKDVVAAFSLTADDGEGTPCGAER
jgi:two-component sensor histidine kinase